MGSEFLSKLPPAFSSIMTASKCMTRSIEEDRYNTIGDASAAGSAIIGNLCVKGFHRNDILFVVYAERELAAQNGRPVEITRLISARLATNFERGLYYGKQN